MSSNLFSISSAVWHWASYTLSLCYASFVSLYQSPQQMLPQESSAACPLPSTHIPSSLNGPFMPAPSLWISQEGQGFFGPGAGDTAALRTGPALGTEIPMHIKKWLDQQTVGDESVGAPLCRVKPERSLASGCVCPIIPPGRPPPACCGPWGGKELSLLLLPPG